MRRLTAAGWFWLLYLLVLVALLLVLSGCVTPPQSHDDPLCFTRSDSVVVCIVERARCVTDSDCELGGV